jgi:hypothetical protein
MSEALFDLVAGPRSSDDLVARAQLFCESAPHRVGNYAKRNWGGTLHSLCSYQGKLKPSIAHFLVSWFTKPGERVLDPMAGVGTIPLEARRQGRVGIASDLSPLADAVSRAKLEAFDISDVWQGLHDLEVYLKDPSITPNFDDIDFGLNGPIRSYYHEDTLCEILSARQYFLCGRAQVPAAARDVLRSSLLHILHGNRPYALSRRSHPVTPFAPTGPTVYRPLIAALRERLERVVPHLKALEREGPVGASYHLDFRKLDLEQNVDAVITSPPFSKSLRFWSTNWMRLWFAGWTPDDFKHKPNGFLEVEQREHFDVYREFANSMHQIMKPGGALVMHLGETATINMASAIQPMLSPYFDIRFIGRESVSDTESHGVSDKGATVAHWYLFGTAR